MRRVQPEDLRPSDITARLGAPWIPASDIEAFVAEVMGTTAGEGVSVAVAAMLVSPVWEISGRASGEGVAAGSPSLIRTH